MVVVIVVSSSSSCCCCYSSSESVSICCRVVKPLVPVVRPKGLGLGADKSILLQTSSNNKHQHHGNSSQEDELVLKRGSYCMLIGGKHDGQYGTVRLSVIFRRLHISLS